MSKKPLKVQKASHPGVPPIQGAVPQGLPGDGRKAAIGAVHHWKGGDYQKVEEGVWKPVVKDKERWNVVDKHPEGYKAHTTEEHPELHQYHEEQAKKPADGRDIIRQLSASNDPKTRSALMGKLYNKYTPLLNKLANNYSQGNSFVKDELFGAATESLLNIANKDSLNLDDERFSDNGITAYLSKSMQHVVARDYLKSSLPVNISDKVTQGIFKYNKVREHILKTTHKEPKASEVFAKWGEVYPDNQISRSDFGIVALVKAELQDVKSMTASEGRGAGYEGDKDLHSVENQFAEGSQTGAVFTPTSADYRPNSPETESMKQEAASLVSQNFGRAVKKAMYDSSNDPQIAERNRKIFKAYSHALSHSGDVLSQVPEKAKHQVNTVFQYACYKVFGEVTPTNMATVYKTIKDKEPLIKKELHSSLIKSSNDYKLGDYEGAITKKKETQAKAMKNMKDKKLQQQYAMFQERNPEAKLSLDEFSNEKKKGTLRRMYKSLDDNQANSYDSDVLTAMAMNTMSKFFSPLYLYEKFNGYR